jgi:hypothetical protein
MIHEPDDLRKRTLEPDEGGGGSGTRPGLVTVHLGYRRTIQAKGSLMSRLFGALALSGVTLAALAVAPSASAQDDSQTRRSAATCYAKSCPGQDPQTTGCAADAFSPDTKYIDGRKLELRYSPTCRAAWGRISGGGQDYVSIHSSSGAEYWNSPVYHSYTAMVNDAGLIAWACTTVGADTCTHVY